jgi:hypothetical protein
LTLKPRRVLAEDLPQSRSKRLNIVALKRSEHAQDQPLFDRGQNGFDQRSLRQPCAMPAAYQHLAENSGRPKNLTRDGRFFEEV